MKKRLFHRGYNIENKSGGPDCWQTTINGHQVESQLTLIKKSIDWWCETKTFMPPDKFQSNSTQARQTTANTEEYKGFRLMNDSGKPNEWYVVLRGRLLKGSTVAIKKHLDAVLEKS